MSPLIRQHQSSFNRILLLLAALVLVTVSGSLLLLWQRQQIESLAADVRETEKAIQLEERRLRFIDTKIAKVHQPAYLKRQVDRLKLDLAPPGKDQIVYMRPSEKSLRIAQRIETEQQRAEETEPFRHTFDLAVIEPLQGMD